MEFLGDLGTDDRLTVYHVLGPLLLVALVLGAVVFYGVPDSAQSDLRKQFLVAFCRGWRLWWRLFMAPFVGTYREIGEAYREFRRRGDPAEQWAAGLRDRAMGRSGAEPQSDSAKLIRDGRDSREQ